MAATAGSTVALDGADLAPRDLERPVIVDPGEHVVELRGGGRVKVTVAAGQTVDVDLASAAAPKAGTPAATSPAHETGEAPTHARPAARKGTGVYLGMALGGAAVAAFTGMKLASARDEISGCKPRCTDSQQADADAAKRLLPVYYGGLAVGLLGVGLLGHAWLTNPEKPATSASVRLRVGPTAVQVMGDF